MTFTDMNTDGYTDAELVAMNEAFDMLDADAFGDSKHIAEMILKVAASGMTAADIYTAVRDRAGVNA